jgi:hypothetical protein
MFLKKLYRHNKIFFFVAVGFLSGYIYLNYKWGITATPINQYGMFSGKYFIKDSLLVYSVKANNKMINFADLSLIQRDLLQSYPDYYEMEKHNNEAIFNTISNYFNYLGIPAGKQQYKFTNQCSAVLFSKWYQSKIENIIKKPITSLNVYKQYFVWENQKLQPIDTPVKLIFIAAN